MQLPDPSSAESIVRRGRPWASVLALTLGLAAPLSAQRPVHWRLAAPAGFAPARGGAVLLRLDARLDEGWYIYSLTQAPGGPTRTTLALAPGATLAGDVQAPPAERYDDPNFGIETETYHQAVRFGLPAQVDAGGRTIAALVRYQTCNDRICLPAHTDTVRLALGARATSARPPATRPRASGASAAPGTQATPAGAGAAAPAAQPAPPPAPASALPATGGGTGALLPFLWLATVMGLLSLLTPCVYPMVPITVGFFSRGGEPRARRTGAPAAAYALGIVASFCALGLLVTAAFGAGGVIRLAADPWLNLAVTALFLGFALNLLGAYELRLPAGWMSRLGAAGQGGHGTGGALLLGAAFAVTTFTCTAPFVGTLLVLATQGSWSWPVLGLLAFSAAFALPFYLLALAPDALARLPRSGAWLVTLRRALGVLELAAAAKFLSNADLVLHWGIFTRPVVVAIWVAAALALALLLLPGFRRVREMAAAPAGRRWPAPAGRALLVLAALGSAGWMATGLRGARLGEMEAFLPPPASGSIAAEAELDWELNAWPATLARARAEHRPVLIDFTGYTCTNCRWMEANMFPRPEVRERLRPFLRARLFTDGRGEPYGAQQALEQRLLGTVALPVYAVVSPAGEVLERYVGMTRDSREFNAFLERGLARARGN